MLPSLANLVLDTGAGPAESGTKRKLAGDPSDGSLNTTIDTLGCVAVPMSGAEIDTADFITKIDRGTRAWFHARLTAALRDENVPQMTTKKQPDVEKMQAWATGRDVWTALNRSTKDAFYAYVELDKPSGRANLFLPAKRTAMVNTFSEVHTGGGNDVRSRALALYLKDRLTFVKQGDSRLGLAKMYNSWSNSGFGKWAHITPAVGLRAALALRSELDAAGFDSQLVGGSHMIYKPPGGTELPAHTDGPRPAAMIALLKAELEANGRFPTTTEWMQTHGIQSLVHFDGGRVDGYTYTIGPMTPKRLYICLNAVQTGALGATDDQLFTTRKKNDDEEDDTANGDATTTRRTRFLVGGTGPSFLNWKENFAKFNAVLAANGETEPLREIPIRPPAGTPAGAFAAVWPVGFPHGSAPNAERRITTTASLAIVSPNSPARDERVPQRVRALAIIADDASSDNDRAQAKNLIASQTAPFAGGKTHLHPEHAGNWFDPTMRESQRGGFYQSIAPTRRDAAVFVAAWEEGDARLAPTAEDWARYEAARRAMPRGAVARRPRFDAD